MNAAAAIGIGTEANTNIGGAEIPGLPGSEIAKNGSAPAAGSSAEVSGSWRDLLHALGLMPEAATGSQALPDAGVPEEKDCGAGSIGKKITEAGAAKTSIATASRVLTPTKKARESSQGGSGEIVLPRGRKRTDPAGSVETQINVAQSCPEICGLALASFPVSASPTPVSTATADISDVETHSADAIDEQRSLEPLSVPVLAGHDKVRSAAAAEINIGRGSSPELKGHQGDDGSQGGVQAEDGDFAGASMIDLNVPAEANRIKNDVPPAQPIGDATSDKRVAVEPGASITTVRTTGGDGASDNHVATLRGSERAADSPTRTPARSNSQNSGRISGAVQQHVPRVSSSPAIQPSGAAIKLDDPGGNPLNAPPVRDMGSYVGSGERATGAVHPTSAASDPFLVLDGDHNAPSPAWIHAGTHHAEAGYLDPALGWIGVRADSASNGVHAALVPNSAEAAQVLGSHMAGLNAYLSEHRAEPATVIMAPPQDGRDGSLPGNNSNDHSSARQEDGGRSETRNECQAIAGISQRSSAAAVATTTAGVPAAAGNYISVMA
jgi:hypothetical protein